MENLKLITV